MPIFNANNEEERQSVAKYLSNNINAAFIHVNVSTLGGESSASAMIKLSLDPKSDWQNGYFENSRMLYFSLERNGTLKNFVKSHKISGKAMRQCHATSLEDAVDRINKYIEKVE